MISTIHEAVQVMTNKKNKDGIRVMKPKAVVDYTTHMSGVDLFVQYMNCNSILRKSFKWYHKLLLHLFNMVVVNAFILNKKFGNKKITHADFCETLAKYLMELGKAEGTCIPTVCIPASETQNRLTELIFQLTSHLSK